MRNRRQIILWNLVLSSRFPSQKTISEVSRSSFQQLAIFSFAAACWICILYVFFSGRWTATGRKSGYVQALFILEWIPHTRMCSIRLEWELDWVNPNRCICRFYPAETDKSHGSRLSIHRSRRPARDGQSIRLRSGNLNAGNKIPLNGRAWEI